MLLAATIACYVSGCLSPFISTYYAWPMAFIELGFIYLSVFCFLLLLILFFIQRKLALWLIALFFAGGFINFRATFAFNTPAENVAKKDSGALRILSWNIRGFDNSAIHADAPNSIRRQMLQYIQSVDADIVCLQEFTEFLGESFLSNKQAVIDLGYPYHYRSKDIMRQFSYGATEMGNAIFSRIPLLDSGRTLLGDTSYPETLLHANILWQNKPLRIYTAHYKSLHLFQQNRDPNNSILVQGDSNFIFNASKFEKIKVFKQQHALQAYLTKKKLASSHVPGIFCGDLNSVPTSYVYHTVSKNMDDAFIVKGKGMGTSIDSLAPTLRIDYLLANHSKFQIVTYHQQKIHLSDHYPHFMDIKWKD